MATYNALVAVEYKETPKGTDIHDLNWNEWTPGPSATFNAGRGGHGRWMFADDDCLLFRFRSISDNFVKGDNDAYAHERHYDGSFLEEHLDEFEDVAEAKGTNKEGYGAFLILLTVEYFVDDGKCDMRSSWRLVSLAEMAGKGGK